MESMNRSEPCSDFNVVQTTSRPSNFSGSAWFTHLYAVGIQPPSPSRWKPDLHRHPPDVHSEKAAWHSMSVLHFSYKLFILKMSNNLESSSWTSACFGFGVENIAHFFQTLACTISIVLIANACRVSSAPHSSGAPFASKGHATGAFSGWNSNMRRWVDLLIIFGNTTESTGKNKNFFKENLCCSQLPRIHSATGSPRSWQMIGWLVKDSRRGFFG